MNAEDRAAMLEKLDAANLKHAEARVKALKARRVADKADKEEREASAALDELWDEYRAWQDDPS